MQWLGEPQFTRRVVGRIGADNDQRFDVPASIVVCQCAQELAMPGRDRIDRRDEIDRRVKLRR